MKNNDLTIDHMNDGLPALHVNKQMVQNEKHGALKVKVHYLLCLQKA